jgi:hypothetical protein
MEMVRKVLKEIHQEERTMVKPPALPTPVQPQPPRALNPTKTQKWYLPGKFKWDLIDQMETYHQWNAEVDCNLRYFEDDKHNEND